MKRDLYPQFRKTAERFFLPFARAALFVIYTWFGMLKVLGVSPAGELVHRLFDRTIYFMSFGTFYILFAWFEVLIGILFLFPRFTRIAIILFLLHMLMVFLPLVLLSATTWQSPFVPTLEGQYILKNLALIACVLGIAARSKKTE